ncbi:MAG: DUF2791 family P-loop domain-containing protein, partial [Archaeoglobaceae archaeon]
TPTLQFETQKMEAKKIIERLRFGIPPCNHLEEFTFGREKEIKEIKNWLSNPNIGSLIVEGEYGSGKTHFLEYVYELAIKNSWAVSFLEVDPQEISFYKPRRVYEEIIRSFKFKKGDTLCDFREFLRSVANSDVNLDIVENCQYLYNALREIREGNDTEELYEWIEGREQREYWKEMKLPASSTAMNIYCNIISGIGWATRKVLGLNGFLILFDECENIDKKLYSYYQQKKVQKNVEAFILISNNDKRLLTEDLVKSGNAWCGEHTGLPYCKTKVLHGDYPPYLSYSPCYVKTLFAFSPFSFPGSFSEVQHIQLSKVTDEKTLKEILGKIFTTYKQAYNTQLYEAVLSEIFNHLPKDDLRLFIKGAVEALDLLRCYPNEKLEILLRRGE